MEWAAGAGGQHLWGEDLGTDPSLSQAPRAGCDERVWMAGGTRPQASSMGILTPCALALWCRLWLDNPYVYAHALKIAEAVAEAAAREGVDLSPYTHR